MLVEPYFANQMLNNELLILHIPFLADHFPLLKLFYS